MMSMDSGMPTNPAPTFNSLKGGSDIIMSHREYVADVKSSIDFAITTYPLNPGNPILFPWFSQIAQLYEEYEFLGVLLEYRSLCATAVGTTQAGMGAVITATDYDVTDKNYTSKRAMEAAEFAVSGVPYSTFIHPIECDPRRNVVSQGYVVPGILTSSQAPGDPRLSVLGNFSIATTGMQTTTDTIGELWISYHVRLSRPILEITQNVSLYTQRFKWNISATGVISAFSATSTGGSPDYAISDSVTGVSTANMTLSYSNSTAQSFLGGTFLCVLRANTTGTATWAGPQPPAGVTWIRGVGTLTGNDVNFSVIPGVDSWRFGASATAATVIDSAPSTIVTFAYTVVSKESKVNFHIPYNTAAVTSVDMLLVPYNKSVGLTPAQRTHAANDEMRKISEVEEHLAELNERFEKIINSSAVKFTQDELDGFADTSAPIATSATYRRDDNYACAGNAAPSSGAAPSVQARSSSVERGVSRNTPNIGR
jgi:hypothetical protein